jgi:hypothetical protein
MNNKSYFLIILIYSTLSISSTTRALSPEKKIVKNQTATLSREITYSENIRPIIENRCLQCHRDGGIAPFALANFEQTKTFSGMIIEAIKTRKMPPWGAKDDGSCQSFHNSMWLSKNEIDTFQKWINQKTSEGKKLPDLVYELPNTGHLDPNDSNVVQFQMPAPFTPPENSLTDEYRCFVTNQTDVDRTITTFDVVPGNLNVVHHVIAYLPKSAEEQTKAIAKGQGYPCTSGPMVDASIAAFWAPGTPVTNYPVVQNFQTGIKIPAGTKLILQVHYNYSQGKAADQSSVRFKISGDKIKEGLWLAYGRAGGASIPPKTNLFTQTEVSQIGQAITGNLATNSTPGFIHAIFPHMHQVGSSIKIELARNEKARGTALTKECLVDVPRWDFHWQRIYWFKKPIASNTLDQIKMTCNYDTSKKSEATQFGEGSTDEMCILFAFVTDNNFDL